MINSQKIYECAERKLTAKWRDHRISALVSNKAGTRSRWEDVTPIKEPSYQEVVRYINSLNNFELLQLMGEAEDE